MTDATAEAPLIGATAAGDASEADAGGRVYADLATLSEKTIIDEMALARMLKVTSRTIRRMVTRFELPRPVRFAGRSSWQAGAIIRHFEARALAIEQEARKEAQRIARLLP